ncbi:MAG: hypothetical protein HY898_06010 [Deltaproteobacteria bacterium]|nr:hypothetical protein [Deltaproteobacteria bacterium]
MFKKPSFVVGIMVAAFACSGGCATGADDAIASNVHLQDGGGKPETSWGGSSNEGGSGGESGGGSGGWSGNAGATGTCTDGDEKQYGTCGKCGMQIQKCEGGTWGAMQCMGEGVCEAGATETTDCGTNGTQTRSCNGACEWDAWGVCQNNGPCNQGDTQTEPCGNCGTRSRTCDANNQWPAWGACQGQGECMIGQNDSQVCGNCGTKTRTCSDTCTWGSYGSCTGEGVCGTGETETANCGGCGTKSRTCNWNCQWDAYGACTGGGECTPGEVGPDCMCSTLGSTTACCGTQVCGNDCKWGACQLKAGNTCNWNKGETWHCCGTNSWQWCLSSCKWSTACASGCNCGC